ncbi:MAG: exodeoxyribonuclease VII large subunit [Vicinamibacterales bacterium]
MGNLFDLPFDEGSPDDAPERVSDDRPSQPPVAGGRPVRSERVEAPAHTPRRTVLSVSELTAGIRRRLEDTFDAVWVEGEVSNYRLWNGLVYFTLKDEGAQLRVIMFRTAVRRLRFTMEDGLHVVAQGRVSVYDQRGEYQLVAEVVEPQGLGALQLAFEQLKKRLAAEGLFAPARKRPLPVLPRRIGIVTSLDGAALRDIIRVITTRHANMHLVIRPTRVQGEGAAADVARALQAVARVPQVDVVIVGRGGGSLEDLWAFNEETVARAIAACPIPVIAAVGHEVDWTIADFVADVRAATPSNAAEIVVERSDLFRSRIDRATQRLHACLERSVESARMRVHLLESRRGLAAVPLRVAARARHVDELALCAINATRTALTSRRRQLHAVRTRLDARDPVRRLSDLRARWSRADAQAHAALRRRVDQSRSALAMLAARLHNLSPLAVLGRGYALCWTADGRTLVREATPNLEGTSVSVTLAQGRLECEVTRAVRANEKA